MVDDYYEDQALEDCKTQNLQPYALVGALEAPQRNVLGEPAGGPLVFSNRAPFYPIGGPTTHWGHAGLDPWTDARIGNKRTRLEAMGVSGTNWMWKMALEARERERELRREREGRMVAFSTDGKMSVYDTERLPEGKEGGEGESASRAVSAQPNAEYPFPKMNTLPVSRAMERVRSGTGLPGTPSDQAVEDVVMAVDDAAEPQPTRAGGPDIVIEDEAETRARKVARKRRAQAGVLKGLYEVGSAVLLTLVTSDNPPDSPTRTSLTSSKTSNPRAPHSSASPRSRSSPPLSPTPFPTPTPDSAPSARPSTPRPSAGRRVASRASSTCSTRRGTSGRARWWTGSGWYKRQRRGRRATSSSSRLGMTWLFMPNNEVG